MNSAPELSARSVMIAATSSALPPRAAARGSFGHSASDPGDGNGRGVMDAELRQAVRRTSAKSVTPGRDLTGR